MIKLICDCCNEEITRNPENLLIRFGDREVVVRCIVDNPDDGSHGVYEPIHLCISCLIDHLPRAKTARWSNTAQVPEPTEPVSYAGQR